MLKASRRKILIISATLILGAWGTGIVMANTNLSSVPCGRQTGLAAIAHTLFFGPSGGCAIKAGTTKTCANHGNCTISGTTTTGKCTDTANGCACQVQTPK